MKLLFGQNLSFKLCQTPADLFPESNHVRLLELSEVGDRVLWDFAKAPRSQITLGGNQSTAVISTLIRRHADLIVAFENDNDATCLEIY
jgi:predicted nuclease of predicted toxin-antitoxin system